jgi:hypothetical protein
MNEKNTGYYTIEEVERYFDLSARLQQQERTKKKIKYLKKRDGAKILYRQEHLTEYLSKQFQEFVSGD